jgi:hypothetical protein
MQSNKPLSLRAGLIIRQVCVFFLAGRHNQGNVPGGVWQAYTSVVKAIRKHMFWGKAYLEHVFLVGREIASM